MNHAAEFDKKLRSLSYNHEPWLVFRDFCEAGALALTNQLVRDPDKETRYLKIVERYGKNAVVLAGMMADVVEGLEEEPVDFLGAAFMRNELGNHWAGQYFTPYSVCQAMAGVLVGDGESLRKTAEEKGFVTLSEPAAGSGGMVLAFAEVFRRATKMLTELRLHVTAVDVSSVCAHMTVIQLSLCSIPAVVVVGNSLSLEYGEAWKTTPHQLWRWDRKLRERGTGHQVVLPTESAQLELFGEHA